MSNEELNKAVRTVKMSSFSGGWLAASASGGEAGFYLRLQDLNGYADFTSAFDQYRIREIRAKLIPRNNVQTLTQTSTAAIAQMPPLFVAVDYDDANAPSSYTDLLQYTNVKCVAGWDQVEVNWKPQFALSAYNGSFGAFSVGSAEQWNDCASAGIQYYGLKAASYTDGVSQTTHQQWDLFVRATVDFRMTH
jgi:hypothetical protein